MQKRYVLVCEDSLCPRELPDVSGPGLGEAGRYIIFGSTNDLLSHEFATMMSREFEMSMIGDLTFFLGFQVKQLKEV